MTTLQTLTTEFTEAKIDITNAAILALFDHEYVTLDQVRNRAMTKQEYLSLGIKDRSADTLVQAFPPKKKLVTATNLNGKMKEAFTIEELKTVCTDLKIDYEYFPHSTLLEFTMELIRHCENRSMIPKLKDVLKKYRNDVDW